MTSLLRDSKHKQTKVRLKRLGSLVFTIHSINVYSSFQNIVRTAKKCLYNWDNLIKFEVGWWNDSKDIVFTRVVYTSIYFKKLYGSHLVLSRCPKINSVLPLDIIKISRSQAYITLNSTYILKVRWPKIDSVCHLGEMILLQILMIQ